MTGTDEHEVAVVTGGTRGIGLAIADRLAATGHTVVVSYRQDADRAAAAGTFLERHSGPAHVLRADVTDPSQIEAFFRTIRSEVGPITKFVSNAGITADGFAVMMSPAKWSSVVDTNLTGAVTCLRAAARGMVARRRGALLAIASTSAVNAPPGQSNYAASKAGLVAAVRVMAKELGPYGVRVNALLPGFVDTDMTAAVPQTQLDKHRQLIPLGRLAEPQEIGPAAAFLLSDEASYITGTTLTIDGGLTA